MFKSERYKKAHIAGCKFKDDNVRALERMASISIEPLYECTVCRFCNGQFSAPRAVHRHMTHCKAIDGYTKMLKEKCGMNTGGVSNHCDVGVVQNASVINNQHAQTINNLSINLVPFGKENFDYIEKELKKIFRCVKKGEEVKDMLMRLIKKMHGHPMHPENHNVLFDGAKKPLATVYTEEGFERKCAVKVSQDLVEQAGHFICDTYEFGSKEQKESIGGEDMYHKIDDKLVSCNTGSKECGHYRSVAKDALCSSETRSAIKCTQSAL